MTDNPSKLGNYVTADTVFCHVVQPTMDSSADAATTNLVGRAAAITPAPQMRSRGGDFAGPSEE